MKTAIKKRKKSNKAHKQSTPNKNFLKIFKKIKKKSLLKKLKKSKKKKVNKKMEKSIH